MYKKTILRVLLVVLVLFTAFIFREELQQLDIQQIIQETETGYWAAVFVVGFFLLKSVLFFIPLFILCFSAGMVLPVHFAIPLCILGFTAEIALTYLYGFLLGNDFVDKLVSRYDKLEEIVENSDDEEIKAAFFARLSPLAIEPVSLLMGAGGFKFSHYIPASLLGMTPRIFIYTIIGSAVVQAVSQLAIILAAILLVIWLVTILYLKNNIV